MGLINWAVNLGKTIVLTIGVIFFFVIFSIGMLINSAKQEIESWFSKPKETIEVTVQPTAVTPFAQVYTYPLMSIQERKRFVKRKTERYECNNQGICTNDKDLWLYDIYCSEAVIQNKLVVTSNNMRLVEVSMTPIEYDKKLTVTEPKNTFVEEKFLLKYKPARCDDPLVTLPLPGSSFKLPVQLSVQERKFYIRKGTELYHCFGNGDDACKLWKEYQFNTPYVEVLVRNRLLTVYNQYLVEVALPNLQSGSFEIDPALAFVLYNSDTLLSAIPAK